jgi:TonB family protein
MMLTFIANELWQGALIAGVTTLALRLVSPRNATTRYAVWLLALFALVAVPVATASWHLGAQLLAALPHATSDRRAHFTLVAIGDLSHDAGRWFARSRLDSSAVLIVTLGLWIAGTAAAMTRLAVSFLRIARIRRAAARRTTVDGVPVLTSRDLTIPIATGIVVPAIVLPETLAETLTESEFRCTLEHELAHVRRGDVAADLVQRLLEAVLFWNPWVYVVGNRLIAEREAACDDWAVHRFEEPDEYAFCLASLGRRIARPDATLLSPSVFGARNALVARIERLAADRTSTDFSLNYIALGGITMLFVLMTLAIQALFPSNVTAATLQPANYDVLASAGSCTKPSAEPKALDAAAPDLPKSQWPSHKVSAIVLVTVAPSGKATSARIYRSSGNAAVDHAVMTAAEKSTYSPKVENCVSVTGTYLFKADFAP